jgi:hypothetical protein
MNDMVYFNEFLKDVSEHFGIDFEQGNTLKDFGIDIDQFNEFLVEKYQFDEKVIAKMYYEITDKKTMLEIHDVLPWE